MLAFARFANHATTISRDMQDTLKVTKALSDASRLRIVVALAGVDELCACQVTEMLGLSPATVSRHLSVLLNANLVSSRKDSQWVYYRLSDDFPPIAKQWLMESLFFSREAEADRKRLVTVLSCGAQAERDSRGTQRMQQVRLKEERRFPRGVESDAFRRQVEHCQNALLLVRASHRKRDAKKEMAK